MSSMQDPVYTAILAEFGAPEAVVLEDGSEVPGPWLEWNAEFSTFKCMLCDAWVSDRNHLTKKRHMDQVQWEYVSLCEHAGYSSRAQRCVQRWSEKTFREVWKRATALQANGAYGAPGLAAPSPAPGAASCSPSTTPPPIAATPPPPIGAASCSSSPAGVSMANVCDLKEITDKMEEMESAQIEMSANVLTLQQAMQSTHTEMKATVQTLHEAVTKVNTDIQALKAAVDDIAHLCTTQGPPSQGLRRNPSGAALHPQAPRNQHQ